MLLMTQAASDQQLPVGVHSSDFGAQTCRVQMRQTDRCSGGKPLHVTLPLQLQAAPCVCK